VSCACGLAARAFALLPSPVPLFLSLDRDST